MSASKDLLQQRIVEDLKRQANASPADAKRIYHQLEGRLDSIQLSIDNQRKLINTYKAKHSGLDSNQGTSTASKELAQLESVLERMTAGLQLVSQQLKAVFPVSPYPTQLEI